MNTNLEDLFGYELRIIIRPKDTESMAFPTESIWIGVVSDRQLSIAELRSMFKTKRIKYSREVVTQMWRYDIPPLLASFIAERGSLILITKDPKFSISKLMDMVDAEVDDDGDEYY